MLSEISLQTTTSLKAGCEIIDVALLKTDPDFLYESKDIRQVNSN